MLGVPYGWREGVRDATPDPELLALVRKADVVSPWSVTRYQSERRVYQGYSNLPEAGPHVV